MKFGPVAVSESEGGFVAHAVRRGDFVLKKGERVGRAQIAALQAHGVEEIVVAQLEPGDVNEDEAARRLALAVAGEHVRVASPFTGRANLFSEVGGILMVDPEVIDRVNAVDESLTVATLPPYRTVVHGEMIATVKIIPFAAEARLLDRAIVAAGTPPLRVAAFVPQRVGVISTLLPGLKPSVIDKTIRIMQARLEPTGSRISAELRVTHDTEALAEAIGKIEPDSDLIVVFGASAITDRRDVIPKAIEMAGGRIDHLGMPVDPGNLLLIGRLGGASARIVLGAPGCARSPKENGFDWVLHRLLAHVPVTAADIRRMGTGGLLMEIVARGQLREGAPAAGGDEAAIASFAEAEALSADE